MATDDPKKLGRLRFPRMEEVGGIWPWCANFKAAPMHEPLCLLVTGGWRGYSVIIGCVTEGCDGCEAHLGEANGPVLPAIGWLSLPEKEDSDA